MKDVFDAGPLVVNMQANDGMIYRGNFTAMSLDVSYPYGHASRIGEDFSRYGSGPAEFTLTLRGNGELSAYEQMVARYTNLFTSIEWRCEWCGSVQSSHRMSCAQCGATRSFLYELMRYSAKEWK